MAKTLQANQIQMANVSDQCVPEGAQIIQLSAMNFDGTGTITYQFSTDALASRKPSSVRAIYFDARNLTADALLTIQNGKTLRLPTGKQGYIPMFWPTPFPFTITTATGSGPLSVELYNFKVQPIIW